MLHTNNRVIVRYPNNKLRVRNCQSTAYPTQKDLGPVTNINEWFMFLRFGIDAHYNADAAFDAEIAAATIIQTANHILKQNA